MKFNIIKFSFFDNLESDDDNLYTYCHKSLLKEFPDDNIIIFHSIEEVKEKYNIPESSFLEIVNRRKDYALTYDYIRVYLSNYIDNMLYLDCDIEILPGFREKLVEMSKEHDIICGLYGSHILYSKHKNDILNSLINEYDIFYEDLLPHDTYMIDNFQKKYNIQLNFDLSKYYIHFMGFNFINNNLKKVIITKKHDFNINDFNTLEEDIIYFVIDGTKEKNYYQIYDYIQERKIYMSFDVAQKIAKYIKIPYSYIFDLNSLKKTSNIINKKHKYKYDLAVGIPIYSITKNKNHDEIINRLKEYICEIKKLFPNIKTQIIFSNNSKENINELKNIEDVEVINNNCNLYAFYARKKAFEASNAFYFWSIDDDVCIYNTKVDIENVVIKHLGDENYIIGSKYFCCIFLAIIPTNIMKKIYDKIGNNSKIKIYGEDTLPYTAVCSLIVNDSEQIKFDDSINFRSFYQDYSSTFDKNNKNILNFDEFIYFITERKRIYNDWFELNWDYKHYTTNLEVPKETKEKIINYFIKNNLVQKVVKLNNY